MAATVWKGYLTFGLISVPIKLHRAGRAEKVSFRQLHKVDASRVRQRLYREAPPAFEEAADDIQEPPVERPRKVSGQETLPFLAAPRQDRYASAPAMQTPPASIPVERSELVKGYEFEKDRYVVISKEELAGITPATARDMQILEFVRLADVDPIYYETSYYVVPDRGGERPYALLYEALRRTGYVAVAQLAMHNREHIVIIRPGRTGMVLHMMFYESEVHREDEYRVDRSLIVEKELQLASMLVENLAAPFEPQKYRDSYREKLDELIAAKIAGHEAIQAPEPARTTPVVNILEALERSLAQSARKPAASEPPAERPVKKNRSRSK
jgi:DNA end-binding protein Ku